MSNLFQISKDLLMVFESLEVDEETGEILNFQALDELTQQFESKAENIALFTQELDAQADAIKQKEKNLSDRRKSLEKKSESLKKYLMNEMEVTGKQKIETDMVKIRVSHRSIVDVWNEEELPVQYLNIKETKSPDKKLIKQAIDSGMEIPGARLVDNPSMQIK